MLKINDIGFNWIHTDSSFLVSRPHGSDDYLFLLLRSETNIFIGSEILHINSPAVVIYEKGKEQKYGYAGEPFTNDWFHFDSDENKNGEVKELLQMLDIPMQTPVYIEDMQTISTLISDLEYEYRQECNFFQKILIDSKIRTLFCKIACICTQEKNIPGNMKKYRKIFTKIRNDIYNILGLYWTDNISVITESLNMSLSYFHHVYKILFNTSPGQDIIKSKISYACLLLSSENMSVSDISEKCRYSHTEHFIRQFKQHMKCTPGEYRNSRRI